MTALRSRAYGAVNGNRAEDSLEGRHFEVDRCGTKYCILEEIGRGSFGVVYKCQGLRGGEVCVAKVCRRRKYVEALRNELMMLTRLQGFPNIIRLEDVVGSNDVGGPALILEYIHPHAYRQVALEASPNEIRFYMRELLIAIDVCHRNGIMHRDIKPGNILIDLTHRRLRLIDFSSAKYYVPRSWNSVDFGTRNYQAPELLLGYGRYDYAVDMWAFGCVFAELIFNLESFFNGVERRGAFVEMMETLGTADLMAYLLKYRIRMKTHLVKVYRPCPPLPLTHFVHPHNAHLATNDSLDLLSKVLKYDHEERLTAREAVEHP